MKNNISLSIGIPAYNEANNIAHLIESIQRESQYVHILEIMVVSDASSDGTVKILRKMNIPKLRVINGKTRMGKALRLNQIIRIFQGDILVLLDADCMVSQKSLNSIAEVFRDDPKLFLIAGKYMTRKHIGFMGYGLNARDNLIARIILKWNGGDNVLACNGRVIAIRKGLAKKMTIPQIVGTDAFMYFFAKSQKKKFKYLENVVVYTKLPGMLMDHLKQSARFSYSKTVMSLIFGEEILSEYRIPFKVLILSVISELAVNPLGILTYIAIRIVTKVKMRIVNLENTKVGTWAVSYTTKLL